MIKSIRGVIIAVLLFVISALLIARGAGALDRSPKVYVDVPAAVEVAGEERPRESGLLLGSDNAVRYEGVIVGRVSNIQVGVIDEAGREISRLEMQVAPGVLEEIPNDALARIVPRTVFGDNEVHLVAPYGVELTDRSTVNLTAGDTLILDTGPEARELYDVYEKVMRAVYDLNIEGSLEGLRELRIGVEGRGEDLGLLIGQGADLLESLSPLIEGEVIPDLRRTLENIDVSLPDIVATMENSTDLADLLTRRSEGIREVLIAGAAFGRDAENFFGAIANDTVVFLDGGTVAVTALNTGQGIDGTLRGLRNAGTALGPVFRTGRLNIQALATFENPLPYSAADCPQYPGLSSPTCGPAEARTVTELSPEDLVPGLRGLFPAGAPADGVMTEMQADPLAVLERELMRGLRGAAAPAAGQPGSDRPSVSDRPSAATAMLLGPIVRGTAVEVS
ncbi:MlaD family protein [Hoyosella altamirensis]|uniref:ABC-type transporter Mla subunit MlaD n=1 Tax=Hoyosella altamirensis TaxID=616997 RepID=A0A839RP41_9ACTN|nr:MlaD family protein [Hoyosella altamirensis]MBB3037691.1 ABC-type transporter Mla subunit MlaD [Hoyosella altamirensis]